MDASSWQVALIRAGAFFIVDRSVSIWIPFHGDQNGKDDIQVTEIHGAVMLQKPPSESQLYCHVLSDNFWTIHFTQREIYCMYTGELCHIVDAYMYLCLHCTVSAERNFVIFSRLVVIFILVSFSLFQVETLSLSYRDMFTQLKHLCFPAYISIFLIFIWIF